MSKNKELTTIVYVNSFIFILKKFIKIYMENIYKEYFKMYNIFIVVHRKDKTTRIYRFYNYKN